VADFLRIPADLRYQPNILMNDAAAGLQAAQEVAKVAAQR
jgi:hypothetical protein